MFELLDIKWGPSTYGTPSGVVTWSEDLSGLIPTSGSDVDDLVDSLGNAFQAWENVAAINFSEVASGADISVSYAPMGGDVAGIAEWTPSGPGLNQPNNVQIEFNSNLNWTPDSGGPGVNFFAVALHEIGHTIGLDHVDDVTQIMNAVIFADDLGTGDKEGAQVIYGTDAGDEVIESDDDSGGGGSLAPSDGDGGGGGGAGLILGLLAAVFALFTGGFGAAAVAAAGRIRNDDDADGIETGPYGENAADYLPLIPVHEHHDGCDHEVAEDGTITHYLYLPDNLSLPMVEHEVQPKGCGCLGNCEHDHEHDDFDLSLV